MIVETDAPVVALLETLIAEVRGLRADLARERRPRQALRRADVARLSRLLPAIVGAIGSDPFTVNEVLELPAVRAVAADLAASACGQLLQRARGRAIGGLVVIADSLELNRRVWRIEATVEDASCTVAPRPPGDRVY